MSERLQKILANTGLGSRRELEGWISEGLIRVNGQEAKLALVMILMVAAQYSTGCPDYHKGVGFQLVVSILIRLGCCC